MKQNFLLVFIILLSLPFLSNAQSLKEKRADRLFDDLAYKKAAELYEQVILSGASNDKVIKRLAISYRKLLDWENAEHWYSLVVEGSLAEPIDYYYYAEALKANEKYEQGMEWMRKYSELENNDSRIKRNLGNKAELKKLLKKPKNIIIKNLSVSSEEADFGAALLKNNLVVFSSARTDGDEGVQYTYAWNDKPFLDLYVADRNATGELVNPRIFAKELNSRYHEGPVVFNKEGFIIYFTRSNFFQKKVGKSHEDINNLKIFRAIKVGEKWGQITNLHFNSDEYSCGHPALSADGKRLYFASDMPGGYGGTDIYVCEKQGKKWGTPKNLGDSINTEGNEMFPHMHKDGTLYYSSTGLFGLGGLDIFMAAPKDSTLSAFLPPVNIGSPINSSKDDFAFTISDDKRDGYLSSNRKGGQGDDDIYYFKLNKDESPDILHPSIINEDPLLTATTFNPGDQPEKKNDQPEQLGGTIVNLDSLNVGETAILKNIYYDLDKWNIRSDAERDLKKVIDYLKTYPTAKLELSSHTDCRAPHDYNMELSRKRAISAVMYIVVEGDVAPERLVAKGYGETQLTNECADGVDCSEQQHQANRRTEVKLLSK